jgi:type IV pilus assembly protein PilN
MQLTLNLATKPFFDRRRVDMACLAGMVLLLGLLYVLGAQVISAQGELVRIRHQLSSVSQSGTPGVAPTEKALQQQQGDIDFANDIIRRKSRNRLLLLDQLEQVTPSGIILSSLQPVEKNGLLKLEGQARNFAVLQTYLKKLHSAGTFKDLMLLSQSKAVSNNGNQVLQFSISCAVTDL